jgi:hypothetical protein
MLPDVSYHSAIGSLHGGARYAVADPESEIWVRMPANREKLEGLSRATLYKLINDARSGIVTISLREPGAKRGVRLLGLKSLRAFLSRVAAEQNPARKHKEPAQK